MKQYFSEENSFGKWFEKQEKVRVYNEDGTGRRFAVFWKREMPLHEPYSILKRDFYEFGNPIDRKCIGRIDLVFRYRGALWVGETKYYKPHGSEFWDACKTLAYCTYYNWQTESSGGFDTALPAILVPTKSVKLQHKIVANKLKIMIMGITKVEKGYSLEEITCPL